MDRTEDRSRRGRMSRYGTVSSSLALLSDRQLARLLDDAGTAGTGIGGTSTVVEVAGVPVFVKRIPLTDLELRPEHVRSTANLFDLPLYCHYGIVRLGGPGFGAWRELAANALTTGWVLAGQTDLFPLMYHWRTLPGTASLPDELADAEQTVAYWHGAKGVRDRIDALATSSAGAMLFLEYIPQVLHDWLPDRQAAGDEALSAACAMVERDLLAGTQIMRANGLLHFDAHFANILTDGHRLYLADLGLAMSTRFDLSGAEAGFAAQHGDHDLCYTLMYLVNWLVTNVCGAGGPAERNAYIRNVAEGAPVDAAPAELAALIRRYAPVVAPMNDFYWDVYGTSRATPYPRDKIDRAVAGVPGLRDDDHRLGNPPPAR